MNILQKKNKSINDFLPGTPIIRDDRGTVISLYAVGTTMSQEDWELVYDTPYDANRIAPFNTACAVIRIGGEYRLVSERVLINDMISANDYSYQAVKNDFIFDWDEDSVEYVNKTELVNLVTNHTGGPLALVWRKKVSFSVGMKDRVPTDSEDFRDFMLGEMDWVVGQYPDRYTVSLSAAAKGQDYIDQTADTTRAASGFLFLIDYNKPFTDGGNLVQVRVDGLLAFLDPSNKKVYCLKTSGSVVTKSTQKRILNTLRKGIGA